MYADFSVTPPGCGMAPCCHHLSFHKSAVHHVHFLTLFGHSDLLTHVFKPLSSGTHNPGLSPARLSISTKRMLNVLLLLHSSRCGHTQSPPKFFLGWFHIHEHSWLCLSVTWPSLKLSSFLPAGSTGSATRHPPPSQESLGAIAETPVQPGRPAF